MTNQIGPGRPRISGDEVTKPYTISLTPTEAEAIRELGNGNLSAGIRKAIDTMSNSNPTSDEAFEMAKAVYDAAYPDRNGERNPDKVAEIEEWLSGPGGWADYAEPDSLAVEWRMVEAEAERIYPTTE